MPHLSTTASTARQPSTAPGTACTFTVEDDMLEVDITELVRACELVGVGGVAPREGVDEDSEEVGREGTTVDLMTYGQ